VNFFLSAAFEWAPFATVFPFSLPCFDPDPAKLMENRIKKIGQGTLPSPSLVAAIALAQGPFPLVVPIGFSSQKPAQRRTTSSSSWIYLPGQRAGSPLPFLVIFPC